MYGPEARTSDYAYVRVEDDKEVWEEAKRIGRLTGERLHEQRGNGQFQCHSRPT
ncbi:hypothetical protein DSCA_55330 [Desulfosarcina alkanivorans]|uniref:Uncharacterized protein n=1 Tax=Desulfosarcina alkanivorans TaxID=571177 RepID=A0A5K7YU80_9BACT|nr:hypothetical protein DSCA_55330 [Desulfosarcina alkanivorans]